MSNFIGIRYTDQHIIRRDTARGVYEELNPRLHTQTELQVQAALLRKDEPRQLGAAIGRAVLILLAVLGGLHLLARVGQ